MAHDRRDRLVRVLVTEPKIWAWLPDHPAVDRAGLDLTFVPADDRPSIDAALAEVDAFVGGRFDEAMATTLGPRCRFLQITAAGTENVPLASLPAGVTVANAYGHEASMAEHILMVTLAARHGLLLRDGALRRGIWRTRGVDPSVPPFHIIADRVIGIVGLGHIGKAIVEPFRSLGARCAAIRRSGSTAQVDGVDWIGSSSELLRLCRDSDVLVLACPLNDETRGMVGREHLEALGPQGCLVNVGRGGLVREDELYLALRDGRLGYAAIDVWSTFPTLQRSMPSTYPFEDLPNVVLTPHSSGTAEDTFRLRADGIAQNLERVARGDAPTNIVAVT